MTHLSPRITLWGWAQPLLSASAKSASIKVGRSMKAQHLEKSEAESVERPSSVLPQGPEAMPTSPRAMGDGASGFIVETLHLGKSILSAFCILLVFVAPLICSFTS